MDVNFVILGRLGNAIFRYMACSLLCIKYNGTYGIISYTTNSNKISDDAFIIIKDKMLNNIHIKINSKNLNMCGFYQHDLIYRNYKTDILNFIRNNKDHYVLTDGILAGDRQNEKFYMIDIITTPVNFIKQYEIVLHLRMEDFVTHNLLLSCDRIIKLLDLLVSRDEIKNTLYIVCKKPTSVFEFDFVDKIIKFLNEKNINVVLENNNVITDYYIMKEAKTLICSNSTLSWVAALLSDKIIKCYFPDYKSSSNQTCKRPIENTEMY
jgi:hypothetical protein